MTVLGRVSCIYRNTDNYLIIIRHHDDVIGNSKDLANKMKMMPGPLLKRTCSFKVCQVP